ncbi:putative smad nuclear interacting protein [Operophtera brumata]|uniref:Putative smad nuclear interacting protein n=1 Tax=Operophtera brumata TaxID=104452 RepID=A0A0L7KZJ9_OPEBR|nr:putative smad nuclear interacting protein [Operophtera brumata]
MADEGTNSSPVQEVKDEPFKKPVLIGRIGKLPKKATKEPIKAPEEKTPEAPIEPKETALKSSSGSFVIPQVSSKELSALVPYKEPKWSGLCPDGKHHCVLQYKALAQADEPTSGWYLYDLGSTHGTYLNKDKLKVSHYTRVRVGHQIKFGNSTRTYILTGPDFDCEGESELTVTEIKQRAELMRLERDRLIQEAKEQRERDKLEEEKKRSEQGIDWGMESRRRKERDWSADDYYDSDDDNYLDRTGQSRRWNTRAAAGQRQVEESGRGHRRSGPVHRELECTHYEYEETGGYKGMKPFTKTDAFRAMNVGFALDEGLPSPDDTLVVTDEDKRPWREYNLTIFSN